MERAPMKLAITQAVIRLLFSAALILSGLSAAGQTHRITGKVLDENQQPIPGINVTVVGSEKATVTGVNGEFSLDANFGDKIKLSYLGYENKVVEANSTFLLVHITSAAVQTEMSL